MENPGVATSGVFVCHLVWTYYFSLPIGIIAYAFPDCNMHGNYYSLFCKSDDATGVPEISGRGCLKIEAGRRRNCRYVLNHDIPFVRIKCIYLIKYMPTLITDKFILCDYLFFPLYFLFFIYNSKWF